MVRCGELCKSCVGRCRELITPEQPAEIECPVCGGEGGNKINEEWIKCQHCEDGYFTVPQCPTKFIGDELIYDIHIIGSTDQHLPVAGGLLDQSAWWFELRSILKSEEHKVQEEQNKRRNS